MCDQKGWHEILGHCNYKDILKLKDVVEGMKFIHIVVLANRKIVMCVLKGR